MTEEMGLQMFPETDIDDASGSVPRSASSDRKSSIADG